MVLKGCMNAVENSRPSHSELLPNTINLLKGVHSVLRMDRYLTHVIQERATIQTFENEHLNFYAKLIPMKQM